MDTWAFDFIGLLEKSVNQPIKIDFDGKEVSVVVKQEVVDFIKKDFGSLSRVSKNVLKEALLLMSEDKDFDARVKIYERLESDELLDKYKADSIKLADISEKIQADKDFWFALCKQIGTKVVFAALGSIL